MRPTSKNRTMAIKTPLGDDKVLLESMVGSEHLSQLFDFTISVLSSKEETITLSQLLGGNVTVRMETESGTRYFNGVVAACSQMPPTSELFLRHQLVVRPWFWFLTRKSDSRIFQNMTVPDIVAEVFNGAGFSDFEFRTVGEYRVWENCVQYQETDFNFVSRLLEQEGLYYFFEHENGSHKLCIADDNELHKPLKAYETIPYYLRDENAQREREHIWDWMLTQSVHSGAYVTNSYDFKAPRGKNLLAQHSISRDHESSNFEIYEYSGEYTESNHGGSYASFRMQELASEYEIVEGSGSVRGLCAGNLFTLEKFPVASENAEHLLVSVNHHLRAGSYESGAPVINGYQCGFAAIKKCYQYRAPLTTPKPEIRGPQTAIVVGKAGDEIFCDEYGRIKVKFHWDRHAEGDETSSCWIRVSQSAAGKSWGGISLPRVGQEVIVEFIDGDPDQPLVTGRVYNGSNKPPYDLPDKQTITGFKSNTSKGGEGFNELRFEDAAGEEQIFMHAQRNQDIRIKNSRFEWVGNERHLVVKKDKFEEVENDRNEVVGADHKEEIGKDQHITIGGLQSVKITKSRTIIVEDDGAEEYSGDYSLVVGQDVYIKAENICIDASDNITLMVGGSSIAIDSTGIKIENAAGTVEVDANMVNVKGKTSSKMESAGITEVKGGMVKIN